ncbi:MAG: class I SAM-dependent methyltransferase [Chloroflexi bacterium]|nr:class I SAM-dependent methyltransferase [Chloroflexota bacterium]
MTDDYARSWAPGSLDEAMFQIDTGNDGAAFWAWGRERAGELARYMPRGAECVVDYGCGVGRVLTAIDAPRRVGVDVSREMLAMAANTDPACEWRQTDGRSIPLGDGEADFVYSLLVLQHMDAADVGAVIADTYRALRPGGTCYHLFSGFGNGWSPNATLARGPMRWQGSREGAHHPAHGALCYNGTIVDQLGAEAGFGERSVISTGHGDNLYWALWGRR